MTDCCPLCGNALPDDDTLRVDPSSRSVSRRGLVVNRLSKQQFAIFECLWKAKGRVIDHGSLQDYVWGLENDGPSNPRETIAVQIMKLRRRLKPLGIFITNAWGVGYAMGVEK